MLELGDTEALGLTDADGEIDELTEEDGLSDGETELDGLRDADGDNEADGLAEPFVNIQPVLLLTFVEFAPAYHVAPPVALESFKLNQSHTTALPLLLNVACDPAVLVSTVIRFPDEPVAINSLTVVVVPALNLTDLGALIVKTLYVPLFENVTMPVPPPEIVILLYVLLNAANVFPVAEVSVILIVEVLALSVILLPLIVQIVPVPEIVHVPEPIVSVLAVVPPDENFPILILNPPPSSVPAVRVNVAPVPIVKLSPKTHEPPLPLKVIFPSVLPPVVIVCCVAEVETNEIADVVALPNVYVMPETKRNALFPAPAVPSPIERVIPEL